jgi:hypothetical protein
MPLAFGKAFAPAKLRPPRFIAPCTRAKVVVGLDGDDGLAKCVG